MAGKRGSAPTMVLSRAVALAIGFVAHLLLGRAVVQAEEAAPLPVAATA